MGDMNMDSIDKALTNLDELQAALWPSALGGSESATQTVLHIMDLRIRLLGLRIGATRGEQ